MRHLRYVRNRTTGQVGIVLEEYADDGRNIWVTVQIGRSRKASWTLYEPALESDWNTQHPNLRRRSQAKLKL